MKRWICVTKYFEIENWAIRPVEPTNCAFYEDKGHTSDCGWYWLPERHTMRMEYVTRLERVQP